MNLPPLESWLSDRRKRLFAGLLLFLAGVLIYSPAMKFDFTKYDDFSLIGGHPQLYAQGTVVDRLAQIVVEDYPRLEPLIVRDLTWLADSLAFGFYRPFGYHYGNVIYHALALVVALWLLVRLTNPPTAVISAVLLLVLAAHVEPVAWIMGRKDILSTLFSLLSILMFLRFQEAAGTKPKLLNYLAAFLFAGAAFLSKINAVILPGIIFFCALVNDGTFLRDGFGARNVTRRIAGHFAQVLPILLLALVVFLWYRSMLADFGAFNLFLTYTPEDWVKLGFIVNPLILVEYLKIILVPWNLEAYYTSPSIFARFSATDIALATLVLSGLVWLIVWLWRESRISCLLFVCFLVAMLPYANWVHQGFWYANRYVYFASFFLIASLVSLGVAIFTGARTPWPKLAVALVLGWVFVQNVYYRFDYLYVWQDGVSLWTHEVSVPGASIADYNRLTATYLAMAREAPPDEREAWIERARASNEKVFELDIPEYEEYWLTEAHYHKGTILSLLDAPLVEQLDEFLAAANADAGYSLAQWNAAMILYQMAVEETDPQRRTELATHALTYFRRNFDSRAESQRLKNDRETIYEQFRADFPEVNLD